jgi:hypothetical protein
MGSLIYLSTTRTNISFAFGMLSMFIQKPCEGHWCVAKRVIKCLKGTQDFRLKYSKLDDFKLVGHTNSDFDGDLENGVSTSAYPMSLGSDVVSWISHKHLVPLDSTIEEKYVVTTKVTKEIVWLKKILEDLQGKQVNVTPLLIDNTYVIKLTNNP